MGSMASGGSVMGLLPASMVVGYRAACGQCAAWPLCCGTCGRRERREGVVVAGGSSPSCGRSVVGAVVVEPGFGVGVIRVTSCYRRCVVCVVSVMDKRQDAVNETTLEARGSIAGRGMRLSRSSCRRERGGDCNRHRVTAAAQRDMRKVGAGSNLVNSQLISSKPASTDPIDGMDDVYSSRFDAMLYMW